MTQPFPPRPTLEDPRKDRVEKTLHDLTNALTTVRSYGEILVRRAKSGTPQEILPLAETLLAELDKVIDLTKNVRRDTYQKGDVLACAACGYTFVQLRASGPAPPCRRCGGADVRKWRPVG